jgi:SAM-dependent methyltransferase
VSSENPTWDGDSYQARFDALAASGRHVHGEADLVASYLDDPPAARRVLDAGCGTGRVAVELASREVDVVGVDRDEAMLATARRQAPHLSWVQADLATMELERSFDVVVLAGNVLLFTDPGAEAATVAGCGRHLVPGGLLVAGFSLDRGYDVATYDDHCADADLELVERFATWERSPYREGVDDYAVSVHRRR